MYTTTVDGMQVGLRGGPVAVSDVVYPYWKHGSRWEIVKVFFVYHGCVYTGGINEKICPHTL
jgi:hypothetical protein